MTISKGMDPDLPRNSNLDKIKVEFLNGKNYPLLAPEMCAIIIYYHPLH